MNYREEMKELRDTLNAHGYRYYVWMSPPSPITSMTICCAAWRSWRPRIQRRSRRTRPPSASADARCPNLNR